MPTLAKVRRQHGGFSRVDLITPALLWTVSKEAVAGWWNDDVPRMGAALAFYTLFALAPILVVAIAVAGMAFGAQAVRGEIVGQIEGLMGRAGAQAIQDMLEGAAKSSASIPATIIGIIAFFVGSTSAFLELQTDLDTIWRVKPKTRGNFLHDLLVQRLISFGLVLGIAFLLLTSLVVSAALAALHTYMGNAFGGFLLLWQTLNVVLSFGVITLLFAMIYKVLPDMKLAWIDVWAGALVTAALFTAGKFLIGLYLGSGSFASTYGSARSVIVILIWVYYSSQIILLGAEFSRAYVGHFRPGPAAVEFAAKDSGSKT